MSEIENPKALFESTCSTNSESFALQNLGDMMAPEFSENCIIIIDPGMQIHNHAYAIIDYQDELYFRQFININNKPLMRCLNDAYEDVQLIDDYDIKGCVVQQKQRKQTALHYYHLDEASKDMVFSEKGRTKK
jgi:phage repressor protein C with HTH and peptisase S24 domain